MTSPTEQWEKDFDNLFNSLGFDHATSCGCLEDDCGCVSPREKMKSLVKSILLSHEKEMVAKRDRWWIEQLKQTGAGEIRVIDPEGLLHEDKSKP